MLTILGKASSINVRKVLWTCHELDIDLLREDWGDGFRSTQHPDFIAVNPNAMVPVMVDGNFSLWESNTICRYLANSAGNGALLPAAPRERARVEQWMDWQATDLNTAWRYAFMGLVRRSAAYADPVQITASVMNWNRLIGILDRHLADAGPFVAGKQFTLADIVLGLSLNRWLMTPMDRPDYPAIQSYYARLGERPAFQLFGSNGIP